MNDVRSKIGYLEERLQNRMGNRIRNLKIVACSDGIVLQGEARTYYAKQLAQEAVMEAQCLRLVANEIQVQVEAAAAPLL